LAQPGLQHEDGIIKVHGWRENIVNSAVVLCMGENGLGVTRSLGRRGIDVVGVDHQKSAPAFSSRFCKKKLLVTNPQMHPEECLRQLLTIAEHQDNKAVLIPTADYYVSFISRFRDQLQRHFYFNIPNTDVLNMLVDKNSQYTMAQKLGIPVPKTIAPRSISHLLQEQKSLSYPVLIKGACADEWARHFPNKAFMASTPHELTKYFELAESNGIRVVVQEIVAGPNTNHIEINAYYSKRKELLALFCTEKTRQFPVDFGVGTYLTSLNNQSLIEIALTFFEGIGYSGVGNIEFKKDNRDSTFKLIELNPRIWQQNAQAARAGVDFAYINYLDCIGEQISPSLQFTENICYLDIFHDIRSFLGSRQGKGRSIFQWIKLAFRADCYAYIAWDDPGPALKYTMYLIMKAVRKLMNKKNAKGENSV